MPEWRSVGRDPWWCWFGTWFLCFGSPRRSTYPWRSRVPFGDRWWSKGFLIDRKSLQRRIWDIEALLVLQSKGVVDLDNTEIYGDVSGGRSGWIIWGKIAYFLGAMFGKWARRGAVNCMGRTKPVLIRKVCFELYTYLPTTCRQLYSV